MKKLIVSILIVTMMGLCFITNISKAESLSATITVEPSATEVKAGDEVTFNFKITNIANAAQGSVSAAAGTLTYDTSFFETVTEDNCSGTLNTENGNFNFTFSASSDKDIGTIKLKVKANATGSGEVAFTELAASDGEEMVYTADKQITISITGSENPDDPSIVPDPDNPDDPSIVPDPENPTEDPSNKPTEEPNTKPAENPGTSNSTVTVQDNNKEDPTTAKKDIPHAGVGSVLTVAVVLVVIAGAIIFKKYKSYQDIK